MIKAIYRNLTDGARIVLAFVVLWYVVPAIACEAIEVLAVFEWPRNRGDDWTHLGVALACISGGALAAGWRRRPVPRASTRRPFPLGVLVQAMLTTAIGAMSLVTGNASWRHGICEVLRTSRLIGAIRQQSALTDFASVLLPAIALIALYSIAAPVWIGLLATAMIHAMRIIEFAHSPHQPSDNGACETARRRLVSGSIHARNRGRPSHGRA